MKKMKNLKKIILSILIISVFVKCNPAEDTNPTVEEYISITYDNGNETRYELDTKARLETSQSDPTPALECTASLDENRSVSLAFFNNGDFANISSSLAFPISFDTTVPTRFQGIEIGVGNGIETIIKDYDFNTNTNPINVNAYITNFGAVGDFIDITFSGNYIDDNGNTRTIEGEVHILRSADFNAN